MNVFSNTFVYLSGHVDHDPNRNGWRLDITPDLEEMGVTVWNPLVKPEWCQKQIDDEIALDKNILIDLINGDNNGSSQDNLDANQQVRKLCQDLSYQCDWMIVNLINKFTWGTIHEIEIGIERNIPMFICMNDNLTSTYGLTGICNNAEEFGYYVHNNINSLMQTLKDIHTGKIKPHEKNPGKWLKLTY